MTPLLLFFVGCALAHVKLYYMPTKIPIRNARTNTSDGTFSVDTDGCGSQPNSTTRPLYGKNGVTVFPIGTTITLYFNYGTGVRGDHASAANRFRVAYVDLDAGQTQQMLLSASTSTVLVSGIDAAAGSTPTGYNATVTFNKACGRCIVAVLDQRNWGGCVDLVIGTPAPTTAPAVTTAKATVATTAATTAKATVATTAVTTAKATVPTTKAGTAAQTTRVDPTTATVAETDAPTTAAPPAPTTAATTDSENPCTPLTSCDDCLGEYGCKWCPVGGKGCMLAVDVCGGSIRTLAECPGQTTTKATTKNMPNGGGGGGGGGVSTIGSSQQPTEECLTGTKDCRCSMYGECRDNLVCHQSTKRCVEGDGMTSSATTALLASALFFVNFLALYL